MDAAINTELQKLLLTAVISGAAVSAAVNVIWNIYVRVQEHKKETAKNSLKLGHIYLQIIGQLEQFARKSSARIYQIDEGLDALYCFHNSSELTKLGALKFSLDPGPNVTELPIQFVAQLNRLTGRFEDCDAWISEQWNGENNFDLDEVFLLERQRFAYYALAACKLAGSLRRQINAGMEDMGDIEAQFHAVINARAEAYKKNPSSFTTIPEIRAQFDRQENSLMP